MGFWKSLGKGLLKAAPIALNFVPGIGTAASIAMQAGLGAANAKASGGGWKDALIGAGTGAAGAKLGGLGKGLSPSKGVMSTVGNIAKQTGKQMLPGTLASGFTSGESGGMPQQNTGQRGWQSLLSGALNRVQQQRQPQYAMSMADNGPDLGGGINTDGGIGPSRIPPPTMDTAVPRTPSLNFPNLADSLGAGRNAAYMDLGSRATPSQKKRYGY